MHPVVKDVLRAIGAVLSRQSTWWASVVGAIAVLLAGDSVSTFF